MNRFVVHTLHRKITHSSIITCKTFEKMEKLKCVRGGGGAGKVKKSQKKRAICEGFLLLSTKGTLLLVTGRIV